MKKIIMICASAFLFGLIFIIVFSVAPFFWMNKEIMIWGMRAGYILMGMSAIILIIILSLERARDIKKLKNEIKEKDLRP